MRSSISYHLSELEIARSSADPRRILPSLPESFGSVLDVGCGIGQTIAAMNLSATTFVCGIDIDEEAVLYGSKLLPGIAFVLANGEQLPLADRSFDVIISRVAIPYMFVPAALTEFARVLKPGGTLWLSLHPFRSSVYQLWKSLGTGRSKVVLHCIYTICNGILFHLTGCMFRFPFRPERCESFQTMRGMRRAMESAGLRNIEVIKNGFLVVSGVKASQED